MPRRSGGLLPLSVALSPSFLGFLVYGVKEPLSKLPELSRGGLALLLQSHVVLSQVLHLLLQHGFVLFLLNRTTHTHRQNQHRNMKRK